MADNNFRSYAMKTDDTLCIYTSGEGTIFEVDRFIMQALLPDLAVDMAPALEAGGVKEEDIPTKQTLNLQLTDPVDSSIAWQVVLNVIYDQQNTTCQQTLTLQQLEAGLHVCHKYHGRLVQTWLVEKIAALAMTQSIASPASYQVNSHAYAANTAIRDILAMHSPPVAALLRRLDAWERMAGGYFLDTSKPLEAKVERLLELRNAQTIIAAQRALLKLVDVMLKVGRQLGHCKQRFHGAGTASFTGKMAHTIWSEAVKFLRREAAKKTDIPTPRQALAICKAGFERTTDCPRCSPALIKCFIDADAAAEADGLFGSKLLAESDSS